jgi:hypothetical protein
MLLAVILPRLALSAVVASPPACWCLWWRCIVPLRLLYQSIDRLVIVLGAMIPVAGDVR